jgi:hypothetical protein
VLGLLGLADQLAALGVSYRFHGLLIREAIQRRDDSGIIAHVIQASLHWNRILNPHLPLSLGPHQFVPLRTLRMVLASTWYYLART